MQDRPDGTWLAVIWEIRERWIWFSNFPLGSGRPCESQCRTAGGLYKYLQNTVAHLVLSFSGDTNFWWVRSNFRWKRVSESLFIAKAVQSTKETQRHQRIPKLYLNICQCLRHGKYYNKFKVLFLSWERNVESGVADLVPEADPCIMAGPALPENVDGVDVVQLELIEDEIEANPLRRKECEMWMS